MTGLYSGVYSPRVWFCFYRHRIIRLWPTYAMMLLLVMTFIYRARDSFADALSYDVCIQEIWKHVLLLSTLIRQDCSFLWFWYVSAEFIFCLVTPPFLAALHAHKWLGRALVICVIVASSALNVLKCYHLWDALDYVDVRSFVFNACFWSNNNCVR